MAIAKPINTIPNTLAVISAECSLSMGSKKWDCNAPPRSPRMLKPMPAVASATTLRTKSFVLLYPACPFALAVALMRLSDSSVLSLTLLYNGADQAGNRSAPHPALSPSDGERVAEGRVRGKRNGRIEWVLCDMTLASHRLEARQLENTGKRHEQSP